MNIKKTFLLLIGGVILLLGSCGGSFLAEDETGGLTLSFLVPSYGDYTGSQARIIDPQSETIVLYLNDEYFDSAAFTPPMDATATYDVTFAVPARTFTRVRIDILDSDGTVLTSGTAEGPYVVTEGDSLPVSVNCVPTDDVTVRYGEAGNVLSGSVDAGTMNYYSAVLLPASYDVTATGCEIYILEEDGTVLVDGLTDYSSFTLTDEMTVYIGLYNGTETVVDFNDLEIAYASTSYAPTDLIFTELCRYAYDDYAFEIYNPTGADIDLLNYTLWGQCWEHYDYGWSDTERTYTFWESVVVPAGEYIVVSEYSLWDYSNTNQLNENSFDSTEKVLNYYNLNSKIFYWGWADGLMIELRDETDSSVDFVAFQGEKVVLDYTQWRWKFGSVVDGYWWYYFDHYYDTDTVARKVPLQDSDSAMDWEAAYGTLGSPNDIGGTQNVSVEIN